MAVQFLHCLKARPYLEWALRDGLTLKDHRVELSLSENREDWSAHLDQLMPLLKQQLDRLGKPLEALNSSERSVIFHGLGTVRGKVPMVCLSEVPQGADVSEKRRVFGSFGIVVKQNWLVRNGGDRVIYVGQNSTASRKLMNVLGTLLIFSLQRHHDSIVFYNDALRAALDLITHVEQKDFSEEAEWRIAGRTGYFGGPRETGSKIPVSLNDIDLLLVEAESDVDHLRALVEALASAQKPALLPKILPFPNVLPVIETAKV